MADTTSVRTIMNADPYSVKKNLLTLFKNRLGFENKDTLEAGFVGYLVQALTLLGSDTLMNNTLSWNESFTTKARLRSSVNDLANMFDYSVIEAKPCQGTLTIRIECPQLNSTRYKVTIKNGTTCSTNNIQYLVKGTYYLNIGTNTTIKRKDPITGAFTVIPFEVYYQNDSSYISFNVDIWQINVYDYDHTVSGAKYGEFYDVNISGFNDVIYQFTVGAYIVQDNGYTQFMLFDKVDNIYSYGSTDKVYTIIYGKDNNCTVRFGSGIFGFQPEDGTKIKIVLYTTKGAEGAVFANNLSLNDNVKDLITGQILNVTSSNLSDINNGVSEENLDVMKSNIIAQISNARRLTSQLDYINFDSVLNLNNISILPLLLKRDTNANEIDLFAVMYDIDGKVIPSTSLTLDNISKDTTLINKDKVYKYYYKKGQDYKKIKSVMVYPDESQLVTDAQFYIDEDFVDEHHLEWYRNAGKLATYQSDNTWKYEDISDEKLHFICPFNIRIMQEGLYKIARYEYIPSSLNLAMTLKKQTSDAGIQMDILTTLINTIPDNAFEYDNVRVNFFSLIHNIEYSPTMTSSDIKATMHIVSTDEGRTIDKRYNLNLNTNDTLNGTMEMGYNIPIQDLPYIDWEIDPEHDEKNPNRLLMETTLYYQNKEYCSYRRYIKLRKEGIPEEINGDICIDFLNRELDYKYNALDWSSIKPMEPLIENVVFNVSSVLFLYEKELEFKDGTKGPGYEMIIYLYKLDTINPENIECNLKLAKIGYTPYTYGVGGNGTILVYRLRIPYNENYIPNGQMPFTIDLNYKFKGSDIFTPFAKYESNVILRQLLNKTMYSSIIENENDMTIFRIPVIKYDYFINNKEAIEEKHLYMLSAIDYNFNDYKMLTDSVNIKYATTIGLTENLKYNTKEGTEINPKFKYDNWAWDISPKITCEIIINPETTRNEVTIIEEVRQVIFSFMSMKYTGFNSKIIKSDIVRYIHDTVEDIISCEITEPTRDIIYIYNERALPKDKDLLMRYVPEFMHIQLQRIEVKTIDYPII